MKSVSEYLAEAVLTRDEVDRFLDPSRPNWARFDPELGYVLRDSVVQDGLDRCLTIGRYGALGERRVVNFADRACRINTYGDSFTMCHQVSDGETWQEYLAAHLGEPIRNFGVGGYGVYQAYRRLVRTELSDGGTPFVVLNVWGADDHHRSLDAWRYLRCVFWFRDPANRNMLHSNPWVHVRIDPTMGALEERPNLCPTPESLYQLCDRDFVLDHFERDAAVLMYLGQSPAYDVDTRPLQPWAECFGTPIDLTSAESRARSVAELNRVYALEASKRIVDMAQQFATAHGKRLMILLSYADLNIIHAIEGRPRPDAEFVTHLTERGYTFVDTLPKHVADYAAFSISPRDYTRRLYIGHYSPAGNHFFAFAVKNEIVSWLDPRPFTYQADGAAMGFADYLPGIRES